MNEKLGGSVSIPKLSIVVPCYKVEEYLPRCLDSLLSQTLDQVEIVCINDGSPDRSPEILEEYACKRPDVFTVINKGNEGVWKARGDGIKAAKGEYIGFVDPDDYVSPDFAKRLYDTAMAGNADIVCCGFQRVNADTGQLYSTEMVSFPYDEFDIKQDPGLLLEVNTALWNKIYRADVIKAMTDIPDIPRVLDDMMFLQLIYIHAGRMAFVPESLVYYMVRDDSIMSRVRHELIPGVYTSMKEVRKEYEKSAPELLDYIDAAAFLHLGISFMYRLSYDKELNIRKTIRDNTKFLDKENPGWRHNPYINSAYSRRHRGVNKKTLLVRRIYGMGLFMPFLALYKFMIEHLKKDIKW